MRRSYRKTERPRDPGKRWRGRKGKEKCDIRAREREGSRVRQSRGEAGRAAEGAVETVSSNERSRQREQRRCGRAPTASDQQNRSHFWTLPRSPVVYLVCLLPHVCSPGRAQGCSWPFSSEGAWGWVRLPSNTQHGPAHPQKCRVGHLPPSLSPLCPCPKSVSSSPFLPALVPAVPRPALESFPCAEPWIHRILEQA